MTTKLINLPHLADMVFGVPHYVTRQTMDSVKAVLIPRIQGITEDAAIQMALNPGKSPAAEQVQPTGGVAVIPVHGILVPRPGADYGDVLRADQLRADPRAVAGGVKRPLNQRNRSGY